LGTAAKRFDNLLIEVYQGLSAETFVMYEDDGQTTDYANLVNINIFNLSYVRDTSNFDFTINALVNTY